MKTIIKIICTITILVFCSGFSEKNIIENKTINKTEGPFEFYIATYNSIDKLICSFTYNSNITRTNLTPFEIVNNFDKKISISLTNILHDEKISPISLNILNNYLFFISGNKIFRLDLNSKKLISKEFKTIKEITTDNKNIFLAGEDSFIVLNQELKELSRLKLEVMYEGKNVHDILIYKNIAYLLDNIVFPLIIFTVDINNPEKIILKERFEFEGVNSHLVHQWLNPELKKWNIIESYGVMNGSGQILHTFPIDKKLEILSTKRIYNDSRFENKKEGFSISAITKFPVNSALWSIIREKDYFFLSNAIMVNEGKYNNKIVLLSLAPGYLKLIQKENLLFLADYNSINIISVEDINYPKIILPINIKDFYPLNEIRDITIKN